jgi:SAM-dependent methyltransferase
MTDPTGGSPLQSTGERLVPELQHGELVHAEHLVRYLMATELASGRRVLDAACGEGYGTALLAAAGARSATGVDLDELTIAHAEGRHAGAKFVRADVRQLPFEDGAFDLVVSFETIEHVRDPESVLDEFRRVLADDGLLIVSTPNKHHYLVENEFHEREFFHEEFVALLGTRFPILDVLLQHNLVTSAVLPPAVATERSGEHDHDLVFRKVAGVEPGGELYTVVLCGRGELPRVKGAAVAAGVDEAHELARRVVDAERTAEMWHAEYERAEQTLLQVYASVWWRATAAPRSLLERVRRRRGG